MLETIDSKLRQGASKLNQVKKAELSDGMPITIILCIIAFLLWGTTSI